MFSPWSELRFAARRLRRAPSFATAVVLVLALGVGATTAVFSLVNGILLEPLPFPEPDRLVRLTHTVRDARRRDGGPVGRQRHALPERRARLRWCGGVALRQRNPRRFRAEPDRHPRARSAGHVELLRRHGRPPGARASVRAGRGQAGRESSRRAVAPHLAAAASRRSERRRPTSGRERRSAHDRGHHAKALRVSRESRRAVASTGPRSGKLADVRSRRHRTAQARRVDGVGAGRPRARARRELACDLSAVAPRAAGAVAPGLDRRPRLTAALARVRRRGPRAPGGLHERGRSLPRARGAHAVGARGAWSARLGSRGDARADAERIAAAQRRGRQRGRVVGGAGDERRAKRRLGALAAAPGRGRSRHARLVVCLGNHGVLRAGGERPPAAARARRLRGAGPSGRGRRARRRSFTQKRATPSWSRRSRSVSCSSLRQG